MLTFSSLSLRRGTRLLIKDASFTIYRGEKVGIVGKNGTGKSSLLSLMLGELQPDAGSFDRPSQLVLAHVAQELEASDRSAIDFVMDGDQELRTTEASIARAESADDGIKLGELHARYAAMGGYDARSRAARLLHGLGFTSDDENRAIREFSGGWRVRLNVSQALMCRSDLVLLDEPTNHLDLDAVIWLEEWLRGYPGTLLMIAHDREFLDRTVNRVVHIEQGAARIYTGNYSKFEEQRAEQLAQQQTMFERQQREIKHMMSFVERFKAKASKARQAQSRIKALERMERIAPAHVDSEFEFSFLPPEKLPEPLLTIDDQKAGYGERVILSSIGMTISPGSRIALLGRNGAGKSTLMKLLAGEITALSGKRSEARDLRIGYFAQHQLEQLAVNESPMEHLKRLGGQYAARATEQELRSFLGKFGFSGDRVFEPVGPFSGGEKARLVLALVSYTRPNLLLLDEPTNHLDLEMRQALAVALQDYDAAVVLVSHDRHLLRAVADELILVDQGRPRPFDGDLDDYARWFTTREHEEEQQIEAREGANTAEQKKQRKREEAEQRNRLSGLRSQIAKLEKEMEKLQKELAVIELALVEPSIYQDKSKLQLLQLLGSQTALKRKLETAESAWLEHSEKLESAASSA
ncbi:MAG: ATP-binding cassette domain-containing protein [Povalibacter sp.]